VIRWVIAGAGSAAIAAGLLVAPVSAQAADGGEATGYARGVIVRAQPGIGPLAASRAAARATDVTTQSTKPLDAATAVIDLGEFLPLDRVHDIADDIARRPGIAWAQPDIWIEPAQPVFPNDPLFPQQWYLWDAAAPDGGFSVRAPQLWSTTTGSATTVVAVIDTGVAEHPDLIGTVIPGYDFVSYVPSANDGNAWDPNPADPGDWFDQTDLDSGLFPASCRLSNSTWHGTHVAGIVAAVANNAFGISGAAPGLRVLNVRALGKCGGLLSDVAAAVRWSVGDTVIDPATGQPIPVNPTPAKVVNLSLGGLAACSQSMVEAITVARSRGAIVIAAAGNESAAIDQFVPANCPGVVRVIATDREGARASYSNIGTGAFPATLAAPGGSFSAAILSTDNTGTREPAQPNFGTKIGTSMAAPLVSAAAGILASNGVSSPDAIRARLVEAVQAFPTNASLTCQQITCGSGILDFSRLIDGQISITLAGQRGTVRGRPGVIVTGTTVGLPEGAVMTPFVKFPGQTSYTQGTASPTVRLTQGSTGEFRWQRRTGKKIYVYFRAETGEQSRQIIIRPR
jgi:serine protease